MPRLCKVEGCSAPRMVNKGGRELTMCETHQRAYWRERSARNRQPDAAPRKPRKRTQAVCTVCGRTASAAAMWAAVGVTCDACHVPAAQLPAPAGRIGQPVLIVDAERRLLISAEIVERGERKLPGAIALRQEILQAEAAGTMALIRSVRDAEA